MKKLIIVLFSVLLLSVPTQAADTYDDDTEDQYQWNVGKKYLDDCDDDRRNDQRGVVIQGEWDTHGKHYTPAGPENKWRQDGTLMQKAAGGYIDTKTGKFIPSTE